MARQGSSVEKDTQMDKGNIATQHEISATTMSPTQRRLSMVSDSELPALLESETLMAEYLTAQFESLLNLRPLIRHPDWFNAPGALTIEKMRDAPDLEGTAVLAKAEDLFERASRGELTGIDEDPQTQFNFFRGNFHLKIIMAFMMVMNSKGVGSGLDEWLGDGYASVAQALEEYRKRIEVRKAVGSDLPYLKEQIIANAFGRLATPLSHETIENYMARIVEAPNLMPVAQDEIERSFALAELMRAFLMEKLGKQHIDGNKRLALISASFKHLTSPEPKPTPSLRQDEFVQKPIEE